MAAMSCVTTFLVHTVFLLAITQSLLGRRIPQGPPLMQITCDTVYNEVPAALPPGCTTLTIRNGNLGDLTSSTFANLNISHITTLIISNNHIQDISRSALQRFTSVSILDASYNDIVCINPNNFEGMRNLSQLYLHGNKIEGIEKKGLRHLSELRTLRLDDNRLTHINNAFHDTPNLVSLNLTTNRISSIQQDAFYETARMENLLLGYNHLPDIPRAITRGAMRKLKALNLMSNNISVPLVAEDLQMEYLHELYLSNNQIADISKDAFEHLDMLEVLHLDLNRLTSFEVWKHTPPQNLIEVALDHNRWDCNCSDMYPWQLLQRRVQDGSLMMLNQNSTTCFTPLSDRDTVTLDFVESCHQMGDSLSHHDFIIIGLVVIIILFCIVFVTCGCYCYCRKRARSHNVTPTAGRVNSLQRTLSTRPKHEYMVPNGYIGNCSTDGNHNRGETNGSICSTHIYDYAKVEGNICRDPSYVNSQLLRLKLARSHVISQCPTLPSQKDA